MISQNYLGKCTDKYVFTRKYLEKYTEYSKYLTTLDLADETREWRLKHIRGFLQYLEDNKITFAKLKAQNIYDYLYDLTKAEYALITIEHRSRCIKSFLNYLYEKQIIKFSGDLVLPKIKHVKDSTIINYYTKEEVIKIIQSIDEDEIHYRRDLVIILLFTQLGMRTSDVKYLKFSNIKWNENKIIYCQHKTKIINVLPITTELRYALIDYLKNERPNSNSEYLFLNKNNCPYSRSAFYDLVNKYFYKAGIAIKNKKHGPHSLRHSLAISILNNKHTIYEIASVLGHEDIHTTKTYLKVDIERLKKISLEVPEWKN